MSTVFFDDHGFQLYSQVITDIDEQPLWVWGLASRTWPGWLMEGVRTGLAYRLQPGRRGERWLALLRPDKLERRQRTKTAVRFTWAPNRHGLALGLEFRVWPDLAPGLVAWRLYVRHRGHRPVWLERWLLAEVGPWRPAPPGVFGRLVGLPKRFLRREAPPETPSPGAVRLHDSPATLGFYSQSWTSWGEVRLYWEHHNERQRSHWLDRLTPPRYVPGAPITGVPNQFWSDFFGIILDQQHQRGLVAGFLTQIHYYGGAQVWLHHLHPALRVLALGDGVRLDPGAEARSDWAVLYMFPLDEAHGLDPYLRLAAYLAGRRSPTPAGPPTGWHSWFAFYRSLTQEDLIKHLHYAVQWRQKGLKLDVFHIDEGYSEKPAQWAIDRRRFPDGLRALAQQIRARGFTPGIWQAPLLLVGRVSARYRNMVLRCRWRRPCLAFWGWNTRVWGLDPTHPHVVSRAVRWALDAAHKGFRFLKLDFLCAGALNGQRHNQTLSRAQALRLLLRQVVQRFRDEAGPAAQIAMGGMPLGSALGLADVARTGPDVSYPDPPYRWLRGLLRRNPDAPCLRNALRNGLLRNELHGLWWINDPDAIPDIPSEELWRTWLTWVSLSGGAWFISADLKHIDPKRARWLLRFSPPLGLRPWVVDMWRTFPPRRVRIDLDGPIGTWHLLAIFRWDDEEGSEVWHPEDFNLPEGTYWLRTFWSDDPDQPEAPHRVSAQWEHSVPAHGVWLFAVRPVQGLTPQYLGSDLHYSQGREVTHWHAGNEDVIFELRKDGHHQGHVWLALPREPRVVTVNRDPVRWLPGLEPGTYAIPVAFQDEALVSIRF